MRKSLEDIKHMVINNPYNGILPEDLKPYHVYLTDSGHSIMCVLETHIDEARASDMDDYEVPVPVKYVLDKGYRLVNEYVVVEAKYDSTFGLMVEEEYYEY